MVFDMNINTTVAAPPFVIFEGWVEMDWFFTLGRPGIRRQHASNEMTFDARNSARN